MARVKPWQFSSLPLKGLLGWYVAPWKSAYLACLRPWVPSSALQKINSKFHFLLPRASQNAMRSPSRFTGWPTLENTRSWPRGSPSQQPASRSQTTHRKHADTTQNRADILTLANHGQTINTYHCAVSTKFTTKHNTGKTGIKWTAGDRGIKNAKASSSSTERT